MIIAFCDLKNSALPPSHEDILYFPLKAFMVLYVTFRSPIHLQIHSVCDARCDQAKYFSIWISNYSSIILDHFGTFAKNKMTIWSKSILNSILMPPSI